MLADKKLIALGTCVAKDRLRPALQHVHVKGNVAEATDGHIMVQATFNEFDETSFPDGPGEFANDDDVFITPKQINKAFSGCPKKTELPILKNIRIGIDREKNKSVAVGTDIETTVTSVADNDQVYPATEQVYPDYSGCETKVTCLALHVLEKLVTLMKASGATQPKVMLQVKSKSEAVKFIIGDYEGNYSFKGVAMPMRMTEHEYDTNILLKELDKPWK